MSILSFDKFKFKLIRVKVVRIRIDDFLWPNWVRSVWVQVARVRFFGSLKTTIKNKNYRLCDAFENRVKKRHWNLKIRLGWGRRTCVLEPYMILCIILSIHLIPKHEKWMTKPNASSISHTTLHDIHVTYGNLREISRTCKILRQTLVNTDLSRPSISCYCLAFFWHDGHL